MQFRTAFNIFNHTQFSDFNNNVGTDFFLRANTAHKARVIQIALKVMF